ncbi:MAG: hypothetical protein GXY83_08250 [Rhodopirellula sp.]|nr:hypothetical protein [Rhodopirellula sp.]
MNGAIPDPQAALRRTVYALLIAASAGVMLGRILAVDSVDKIGLEEFLLKQIPEQLDQRREEFVEQGLSSRQIEEKLGRIEKSLRQRAALRRPFLSANDRSRWCTLRALVEASVRVPGAPYAIDKVIQEPGWDTIDMVKHDGHLYSSKPPLFPTLMAAEYWLIHRLTGASLGTHPYQIGRFMLVTINVLPLIVYFLVLSRLVERFGTTDFSRVFVMAAATFGTLLTTFAVVLNNHLPAAVSVVIALYAAVRIWFDGERRLRYFVVAGVFSAFAAANELPALSFLGLMSLALLWKAPRPTLLAYVPAAAVIAAGFFFTNWVAHGDLAPAYAHRDDGGENWYDYTYQRNGRTIESYWRNRVGIDRGEASPATYALNVLVGHHGIFSLSPIWILAAVGLGLWLIKPEDRQLRWLASFVLILSLVCLVFYLSRPQDDRNYGGMTAGFRWMFWFAPLWLVTMLPAADRMAAGRWRRGLAYILLAISALSASYPIWNPWTHPWLLNYMHYLGWIQV